MRRLALVPALAVAFALGYATRARLELRPRSSEIRMESPFGADPWVLCPAPGGPVRVLGERCP